MIDPRDLAWRAVDRMISDGLKKHDGQAWRSQPIGMHLQKGTRHSLTTMLLLEHPEFCKDPEGAVQHLEQAICRLTMALAQLLQKEQDKGIRQFYSPEP